MNIIADSSTTRTEWVLVDGDQIIEHAFTVGLNPFFNTRREISHIVRLELPDAFFRRRWNHVHFYGAGCSNFEKRKTIESSLVAQFKTPVTVESDLLGAARGLLVHEPGLACILGTGSNSCLYDGEKITRSVAPLGFILGDEGSGAYIGKRLIADILKGLAPQKLANDFYAHFNIGPDRMMDAVYTEPLPSRTLSQYSTFLKDYLDDPYARKLIYDAFMAFFERNIAAYQAPNQPLSFVGSTCVSFESILRDAAADFGMKIAKISQYSMPGLVEYHATE